MLRYIKGLDIASIPIYYQDAIQVWNNFLGSCSTEFKNDILNKNIFIYTSQQKKRYKVLMLNGKIRHCRVLFGCSVYVITTNCRLDGDCTGTGDPVSLVF